MKALKVTLGFVAIIAILTGAFSAPARAQKMVFAHYMITNQDYGTSVNGDKVQGYMKEIQQAQAAGIDGFILNCGGWITQTYYITYSQQMFQAALNLNSGFKLFFSCDFCCGNGVNDAEDMVRRFANDPNYSKVYYNYNGKYVLTTFDGSQIGTGGFSQIRSDLANGTNPNPVPSGFSQSSTAPLQVFIIPALFWGGEIPSLSAVQSGFNQYASVIDGSVYWGIAGVPGSGGSVDQLPSSDYYAQTVHGGGKLYMAPICPQFWGANANRYFEYSGYSGLRKMFMDAINTSHPEWLEVITWNDFVEGSYASPIDDPNAYPNSNYLQFSNTGFYHTHNGFTSLLPYFISWYKNGSAPSITQDSIYWAYRTQPASYNAGNPSVANIYGPISDSIYVTANLTSAATIKVTCGGNVQTINASAGSNDYAVPFSAGNTPNFQVIRNGTTEINVNGTDQIQTSPSLNDYYYSTGSASSAPQGGGPPPTEGPYGGTPAAIPGTVQAENYDTGGQGLGYSVGSVNGSANSYRTDGVDLESTIDTNGGYDVGWAASGQWYRYTVNVATAGTYTATFRVANGGTTNGSFNLQNSSGTVLASATVTPTGGWQTWTSVTANVTLPAGQQVLTVYQTAGGYNLNYMSFAQQQATEAPYGGTPAAIPGTVQAENFDTGGEGVAYHDADAANLGGQYRTSEGVDIETCSDTGGGYDVGWNAVGEWQKFTVNVSTAGAYTVTFRVSNGTTANGGFHLQDAGGTNLTGAVTVAPTGGWQTWTNVTANVTLPAGQQVLTLWDDNSNYNINFMSFASSGGGNPSEGPYGGTPAAIPGTVQSENYDTGGAGVGYNATAGNGSANGYRADGIDLETCSDTGGGYDVGWTSGGQWFKYTVNVAAAGTYTVSFRVAAPSAVTDGFHLASSAGGGTGNVNVPATGGWQTWTTVTATITLAAGQQTLTLSEDNGGWNINDMSFASGSGGGATNGSLSGSVAAVTGSDPLNMTSLGTSDWAVWGYNNTTFTHDANGGSQIGNVSTYGGGTPGPYNNSGYSYFPMSWTNGTPTASVSGEQWLYTNAGGVGDGFQFTVPASTTSHKLIVYVGGWSSGGTLTASLSDGSAAAYTDSSQSNSSNSYYSAYTLTFNAASAGQTLTVVWKQASGTGNVDIFGAALQ